MNNIHQRRSFMITHFKRNCSRCNIEITYKTKETLRIANKNNTYCKKCRNTKMSKGKEIFKKKCSICSRDMVYKRKGHTDSVKNNRLCKIKNNTFRFKDVFGQSIRGKTK